MCLIVVAWRIHPDYPLAVAANRDEFLDRPATPAHWWSDTPDLLAGRDLEAGGTWMGLTRHGRFAALTNYRDPSQRPGDGAPSRGLLVRDALLSTADTAGTLAQIATDSARYAGFNLLVSDGDTLGIHESTTGAVRLLEPGIYGLSNHLLDTPWPKVHTARKRFAAAMHDLPDTTAVLALLRDPTPSEDAHLPETGVSLEWERHLSPAFIRAPAYGTRCSSLILAGKDGQTLFHEWTWEHEKTQGDVRDVALHGEVTHRFKITRHGT